MNKKAQIFETIFAIVAVCFVVFGSVLMYTGLTGGNSDRLFIGIVSIGLAMCLAKIFK